MPTTNIKKQLTILSDTEGQEKPLKSLEAFQQNLTRLKGQINKLKFLMAEIKSVTRVKNSMRAL